MQQQNNCVDPCKSFEPSASPFLTAETAWHLQNLTQNANLTVTAAQPQENSTLNKRPRSPSPTKSEMLPAKRRRLQHTTTNSIISAGIQPSPLSNPFSALPISLISNGTLSVTSDSAFVKIENGVPILKENSRIVESHTSKPSSLSITIRPPHTEAVPSSSKNSPKNRATSQSKIVQPLPPETLPYKDIHSKLVLNELKKGGGDFGKDKKQVNQLADKVELHKEILKTMLKVSMKTTSCPKRILIPNPNQLDFVTLLGLEIVVDSCCPNDKSKSTLSTLNQKLARCTQCQNNFSGSWESDKNDSNLLCQRCAHWNKYCTEKREQTILLNQAFMKTHQMIHAFYQRQWQTQYDGYTKNLSTSASNPSFKPASHQQQYKNYLEASTAFKNDTNLSDLTKLGAAIASNPHVCEAAQQVNVLNSSANPFVRAHAIQNFQFELFKGLHQGLAIFNPKFVEKVPTLSDLQQAVSQMAQQANVHLKIDDINKPNTINTPIEVFQRAMATEEQELMKTIQRTRTGD